jgi:hypothetical protein
VNSSRAASSSSSSGQRSKKTEETDNESRIRHCDPRPTHSVSSLVKLPSDVGIPPRSWLFDVTLTADYERKERHSTHFQQYNVTHNAWRVVSCPTASASSPCSPQASISTLSAPTWTV